MNHLNKWFDAFTDCLIDLQDSKVKVVLEKADGVEVDASYMSQGYWDDCDSRNPELHCAVHGEYDEWMLVFLHEYCHFLQWSEKTALWKRCRRISHEDEQKVLSSDKIHKRTLNAYISKCIELELDCEKRTVKLIEKYDLDVDIEHYIKAANCYLFFYTHMKKYRKWYPIDNPPSSNEKLIKAAPKHFLKDYSTIPPKLEKLFKKEYPYYE